MKLWHLNATRAGRDLKQADERFDALDPYEDAHEWIVRSETPERAREMVAGHVEEHAAVVWRNTEYSTCEELTSEGAECIVLGG